MSKLFIHGSGMLKRIPVSWKDWKWDAAHSWTSLLELGSCQPVFPEKNPEDFLVVELSYMVESRIVQKENGQMITRNRKNLREGIVTQEEETISVMSQPVEEFQQIFDRYIQWIGANFSPAHIILVRTKCPDRCLSGAFIHKYSPRGKKAFQEKCQFFEEYFMAHQDCIVVDITGDFLADSNDMRYGLYVSYERIFYRNMGKIIKEILSGKSAKSCYDRAEYRLLLRRYREFYPVAYPRKEEDFLLSRTCAVNCLVRALNPAWIEKYEDFLIALAGLECKDYKELLERGDFTKERELGRLVEVLQQLEEESYTVDSLTVLEPFWGTQAGIERQILGIIRKFYGEREYLSRHMISIKACQALYSAMVYALQEDYVSAWDWVQKLFPERKRGVFRRKSCTRQDFWKLLSEYGQLSQRTGVDVWGNVITRQVFSSGEETSYISHEMVSVNMLDDASVKRKWEMLWSNSAALLVFDIYWVVDTLGKEKISEEEIRERLDTFMSSAISQYGRENIVFHRITIQREYVNEQGETLSYPSEMGLKEKAQLLDKYQNYVSDNYDIFEISLGDNYSLREKSQVAALGINYQGEYFTQAYASWEAWRRERMAEKQGKGVHQNFISAYPALNLGDDLFIHMLVQRYPREQFTLYVKNHRLQECYSKYHNLEVVVRDFPLWMKKCRNHILIGGSMFIENVAWGVKYLHQCYVQAHARKNFLLGANFGPYTRKEYLDRYQELFHSYQDICFREKNSYQLFSGNKHARVAPDIVFGYEYPGNIQRKDRVVISVIQLKGRVALEEYKSCYDNQIACLCREFLQAGTEVVLLSFCRGEGDEQAIRDICGLLDEEERQQVRVFGYLGENFEEIMKIIAESRWVVGSRFHAVVLGFALGKTVYPVLYSDKTKHMLEDIAFRGGFCPISEIQQLTRQAVLENEDYPPALEEVKQEAGKQFNGLDKIFCRKGEKE